MSGRTAIAEQHTWNLSDLYSGIEAWRTAKAAVASEIPALRSFTGQLGASATALADALDLRFRLDKEIARLYVYANALADQDTRVSLHQGMQQEMLQLA